MLRRSLATVISTALLAAAGASTVHADGQADIDRGRTLFAERCSSCHGADAMGVEHQGPSLVGVGGLAADFELSTGRMPLAAPNLQPIRSDPSFSGADIRRLVAYIASLGGPAIPSIDPSRGSLLEGRDLFALQCAGCHQISGAGGVVTGATVPALDQATPTQIGEAVRLGPYLMPRFGPEQLDQHQLDSIALYVTQTTRHPDDAGGLPLGHLGPIPEGMVAWLVAMGALLVVARMTGERAS
jgi:ubiquinol-cytochrome c reductase cytochrome c subunit